MGEEVKLVNWEFLGAPPTSKPTDCGHIEWELNADYEPVPIKPMKPVATIGGTDYDRLVAASISARISGVASSKPASSICCTCCGTRDDGKHSPYCTVGGGLPGNTGSVGLNPTAYTPGVHELAKAKLKVQRHVQGNRATADIFRLAFHTILREGGAVPKETARELADKLMWDYFGVVANWGNSPVEKPKMPPSEERRRVASKIAWELRADNIAKSGMPCISTHVADGTGHYQVIPVGMKAEFDRRMLAAGYPAGDCGDPACSKPEDGDCCAPASSGPPTVSGWPAGFFGYRPPATQPTSGLAAFDNAVPAPPGEEEVPDYNTETGEPLNKIKFREFL